MQYSLCFINDWYAKAPKYSYGLCAVQSGYEEKDINAFNLWLREYCGSHEGMSFLMVVSTHEGRRSLRRKIKTDKRGRPRTEVIGPETARHIHLLLISTAHIDTQEATQKALTAYFRKRRKKRPNLNQQRIIQAHEKDLSIVPYMMRQADQVRRYGTFDFEYYDAPF